MRGHSAVLAFLGALAAVATSGDTLWLLDGDRISGRVAVETPRAYQLETQYGRLTVPRARVEKRVWADGREELIHPRESAPQPAPTPTPEPLGRLTLVVTGKSFWQAWEQKDAPLDPSLRLELRLDEDAVATFTDAHLDPDMPKAVVNTFSFAPGEVHIAAAPRVVVSPPEVRPGRIVVRLDLPAGSGSRKLRLAYQVNDAGAETPTWRDVAESSVYLEVRLLTFVTVKQDRGSMEFSGFSHRKMKDSDTFRIELHPE